MGYKVVGMFEDKAVSRNSMKRPGLIAAIDSMKRGTVLLAYEASRFGAGPAAVIFEHEVEKKKCKVEFVQGGTADTPQDKMIRHIMFAIKEFERVLIGERTRMRMNKLQASGHLVSGQPPYGFMRDPNNKKKFIKHKLEWAAVRDMKKLRALGCNYSEIARQMEILGHPRRGAVWHHVTVNRILAREIKAEKDAISTP